MKTFERKIHLKTYEVIQEKDVVQLRIWMIWLLDVQENLKYII